MKGKNQLVVCSLFPLVGLCLMTARVHASLPPPRQEDAIVVERSELIVVGRLKEGSISGAGGTLVVKDVIKGKAESSEIPIVLRDRLYTVTRAATKVGRSRLTWGRYLMMASAAPAGLAVSLLVFFRQRQRTKVAALIAVAFGAFSFVVGLSLTLTAETSVNLVGVRVRSTVIGDPDVVLDNLLEDRLWFLRKGCKPDDPEPDQYGIDHLQDVAPLELKEYFLAYLAADPEQALKDQVARNPALARRVVLHLERLEVQRLVAQSVALKDPRERVKRLLPFCGMEEAREGIVNSGEVGAQYLLELYESPEPPGTRADIIGLWGEMRYEGCVDALIELLKTHDTFWANQKLAPGWWDDTNSPLREQRHRAYWEVWASVRALRQIGASRAKEAIELTKRRWQTINFEHAQIVQECEAALREFVKGSKTRDAKDQEPCPTT